MTIKFARSMFLALEEHGRSTYMQKSFQAWHDDGMTVDDTHKIKKKVFVNTTGRTRVRPFTAVMTILNEMWEIVSSRYKYTKSHEETKIFLEVISDVRLHHGIEPLKYVSLDNPEGDVHPFN